MEILVLGGSVFLSRAVAEEALRRGHGVTCASRGATGRVPDGARFVRWDRSEPPPEELAASYDAVVDVARMPSWVRRGVARWPQAHWVFVSTVNVYDDDASPTGRPGPLPGPLLGRLPLRTPQPDDVDLAEHPEAYGPMKVACEQVVREGAASWTVVRPGLIGGPGDRSGRFTYWPVRLAEGGEVLAGGRPDDPMQVIDVRDLAAWLVDCAEQRTTGDLDAVGQVLAMGDLLDQVAAGVGSSATLTWVPDDVLAAQGVEPWMGPGSLPMWVPRSERFDVQDPAPAVAAGLVLRPVAETARDTLAWARTEADVPVSGISRAQEAAVLAAWHTVQG